MRQILVISLALLAVLLIAAGAFATDPYGPYGYGAKIISSDEWKIIQQKTVDALVAEKDFSLALEKFVWAYNHNLDRIPDEVRRAAGEARINIRVVLDGCPAAGQKKYEIGGAIPEQFKIGGEVVLGVETKAAEIASTSLEEISNPTLVVKTNESVLCKIMASDDPEAAFGDALAKGEITYEATTLLGKVMQFFAWLASQIVGFFAFLAGAIGGLLGGR